MEHYKTNLKITRRITAIAGIILAIFCILMVLAQSGVVNITPTTGDSGWQSQWRGMVCGASFGLSLLMFAWSIRITKALKSEKELKKLHNEVNDERKIQIMTAARSTATQVFLIGGIVAGIAAGYFSTTISITILACVFIQSLIGIACKLYYSRKF